MSHSDDDDMDSGDFFEQFPNPLLDGIESLESYVLGDESELPDLDTLVWKLVRTLDKHLTSSELFDMVTGLDVNEAEYVAHALKMKCPECGGTTESGRDHMGTPLECKTCIGRHGR